MSNAISKFKTFTMGQEIAGRQKSLEKEFLIKARH
jgi:hypothetical protein